jgi:hypothetical protein
VVFICKSTSLGLLHHNDASLHHKDAKPCIIVKQSHKKSLNINTINLWHKNGITMRKALA